MAEVRQRKANGNGTTDKRSVDVQENRETSRTRFSLTDVLRILGGLFLLNSALSYFVTNNSVTWGWRPWFSKPAQLKAWISGPLYLTDAELLTFDGTNPALPIYLALNGTIYDVTAGRHMYGPGGSYSFFAGHDAARAFVTGCFDTDLTPDMRGIEEMYVPLDPEGEVISKGEAKVRRERELRLARKKVSDTIEGWAKMFRGDGGKPYFKVGEMKREKDWLEKTPKRELCDRAKGLRKVRKPEKKGP